MGKGRVRSGRLRLGLIVAATGLAVLGSVASAAPRTVRLTLAIKGSGTVRIDGARQVACATKCQKTFSVRAGSRLVLTARPGSGWKLTAWAGACQGGKATCSLRMTHPARVAAAFVPPGVRVNPIPLGKEAAIDEGRGSGWYLKVVSVIPSEDFLVLLSATPRGVGSGGLDLLPLITHLFATVPGNRTVYQDNRCGQLPAPQLSGQGVATDLGGVGTFVVSQTVTGYVCFRVPPASAEHLLLFTEPPLADPYATYDFPPQPDGNAVWFALR